MPDNCNVSAIANIIGEAAKQPHGTSILIMEDAQSETERLCYANRGIKIKKVCLSNKSWMIKNFSSIDGAILLDLHCNCWGIGVVLDGRAVIQGDISRGARYNSVYNYILSRECHEKVCIGIILSEDGLVNIVSTSDLHKAKIIKN